MGTGNCATGLHLEELLTELRLRHWTLLRWGPPDLPELLAATYAWPTRTDVLLLRAENDATGHRTTVQPPFSPGTVTYQYHSSALWTLRAMLSIPPPQHHRAAPESPQPQCFLPPGLPRPILIRPL